jgi:formylglycine-generating enzyme required for sulfatase activity
LWGAIKDSTVPVLFEDFLRRFPESKNKSDAQSRLVEVRKLAAVAPPAPLPVAPLAQPAIGAYPLPAMKTLAVEQERALKPKDDFKECDKCPDMVVVPGGEFTMGSPANEPEREASESPPHRVTISKAFAVGRLAVTFEEWDACVAGGGCNGYRPWDNGWGRGRQPVINVSWSDAKAYVEWLSKITGKTYRLLTEAEREYVTRAETATAFWWGKSISAKQANYNGQFAYPGGSKGENRQKTMLADAFDANGWKLRQTHGNVWEWVEDCVNETYKGAPSDGSAWLTGDCKRRGLRGGSWVSKPALLRSAARYGVSPDGRVSNVGFRVARTIAP